MLEYQYADKIKQLLPPLRANSSLVKLEDIAKACISIFGMPKFYDERRVVEELCRENNIPKTDREPCIAFPIKNIANLSVGFLKRAMEERLREEKRMTEDEALRKRAETARNEHLDSLSSVGELTKAEIMFRGEEVQEEKKTSSAPNYEGYYWKNGASGTLSENLKKKVNTMVSTLREYYISSGQNHKVGELRQRPLILTSVKMRSVKEQIGYIFDEYEVDKENTKGSYRNFRKDMAEYFKKFHLTESKENAYTAFLKQYGSEEAIEKVFIDRKLYHVGGNAVDIRINPPFTDDIVALSKTKTLSYVVYLALIHTVGKGGEHLHVSFTYN